MEITGTGVQAVQSGSGDSELVLKEGEQVDVNFVRKLESGMFILNVNGKNLAAQLSFNPESLPETLGSNQQPQQTLSQQAQNAQAQGFTAQVIKTPQGIQLKIFPPLVQFSTNTPASETQQTNQSTPQTSSTQAQNLTQTQSQTQPQTQNQAQAQNQSQNQSQNQTQTQQEPIGTALIRNTDVKVVTAQNPPDAAKTQIQQGQTQTSAATQTAGQPSAAQTQQTGAQQTTTAQAAQSIQSAQAQQTASAGQIKQAEAVVVDGKTVALKLPQGSVQLENGEPVHIDILKMQDNGKTLIAVKDSVFEVKLEPQVLKFLTATAEKTPTGPELALTRMPVENLDQNFVKQQVSGLSLDNVLKALGKFSKTDMSELTGQQIKDALKNSGLEFESKLMNGTDVSSDEKLKAYMSPDTTVKDGITRMQVTNLMMAGGMFAFLKTQDENVSDTFIKYKKNRKGSDTIYVSTQFSELGETLIIIKPANGSYNVTVKTEKDISDIMGNLSLENGSVRWYKFNKQDLDVMNPKTEIASELGSFEVII